MLTDGKPPAARRRLALTFAHETGEGARKATWLELFFDLVYVVAIANLGKLLLADHSPLGALVFLGLFVPVWWAWIGISYFVDQYQLPETALRLLMLLQIALSLGLAIGLPEVVKGHPELFVAAYLGLRGTLTALYVWAAATHPEGRELNLKYALGFGIGTALWAVSLAVDGPARYVLWGVAIALEIVATILAYTTTRNIPAQVSHMPERFGLFTIIVLGESVIAVAAGTKIVGGAEGLVIAICGVLLAFAVWWLYFDHAEEDVIDRALRGGQSALLQSFAYGYTHLLVFASIVAASIGLELAFKDVAKYGLSADTRMLLCGGLALYLGALSVVQHAGPRPLTAPVVVARLAVIAIALLVGFFGAGVPAVAGVVGLTAIVIVLVALEDRLMPRHQGHAEAA